MRSIYSPPTEGQIVKQLRAICLPKGIRCPKCSKRYDYKINDRYYCKKCRFKFSFKRCLFCSHTKLSFQQIWVLLICWTSELSFQDTERITNFSHVTIRRWFRRFNELIPRQIAKLSGTVEMDEAFVGRRRFNNQLIILGALERESGKTVLKAEYDREQGTLDRFLLKHIEAASLVCTDAWPGYENITEFLGYGHRVVNHSMGHFGITNRIENTWMRLKRFIKKVYHHVWKEHLPNLLKEFQARISNPKAFTNPINFLSYVFQIS